MWWLTFLHDLCSAMSPQSCPVLTLKKLLLLSVRPQEGFLGCELEAMLSSCQQDSVLLPFRSASAEAGALWDKNMLHFRHLSCGAQRKFQFRPQSGLQWCSSAGNLWLSLSSPPPLFYFGLNCCPLITCLHRFLTVSHFHSLHSFILFSCPHPVIIYFPSRTASVPTQLLSFPTHRKLMSPNMRKRKCLVVFNFHKVKTETGLHLHIFKISFMVFIFVSVSESFHRPALLCSQAETIKTSTFLSCRGEGGAGVLVNQGDAPFVRQSPHPLLSPSDRKPLAPPLTLPPHPSNTTTTITDWGGGNKKPETVHRFRSGKWRPAHPHFMVPQRTHPRFNEI